MNLHTKFLILRNILLRSSSDLKIDRSERILPSLCTCILPRHFKDPNFVSGSATHSPPSVTVSLKSAVG